MGRIIYNITSGELPITVQLLGSSIPDNIETTYGQGYFESVPPGDYFIKFIDSLNCVEMEPISYCDSCPDGFTSIGEDCEFIAKEDPTEYLPLMNIIDKRAIEYTDRNSLIYESGWNPADGTGDKETLDSSYWTNDPINTINGPMNRSAVWAETTLANQDIKFSFCIDIAVAKTYYVGVGVDNTLRMIVNGIEILKFPWIESQDAFKWWHIYPIDFEAGRNVIEIEAHNFNSIAAVGIEIYDATANELKTALSDEDLGDKLIFRTKDLVGTDLPLEYSSDNGYHGYKCQDGWYIVMCDETPYCAKRKVVECDDTLISFEEVHGISSTTGILIGNANILGEINSSSSTILSVPEIEVVNYGYLYNWYTTSDVRNITNTGWNIPTKEDFFNLRIYLDPDTEHDYGTNIAGGRLKEIGLSYWLTPNTGAINDVGFNAKGAGYRQSFFLFGTYFGIYWNIDEYNATNGFIAKLTYNTSAFATFSESPYGSLLLGDPKEYGHEIRLIKSVTTLSDGETGTYVGNDGKVYRTICVGTQEWLADNLTETKWRTGAWVKGFDEGTYTLISDVDWSNLTEGAMCVYNNDENNA